MFSTLLTLFVVPMFYSLLARFTKSPEWTAAQIEAYEREHGEASTPSPASARGIARSGRNASDAAFRHKRPSTLAVSGVLTLPHRGPGDFCTFYFGRVSARRW
jgi:hypothetical protein